MTLEERINQDLKEAMKAQDKVALRGIRAVKAAILLAKTETGDHDITPDREMKILQKLVKQRKESLDTYQKNNRDDLARIEREEIEVIERYLPKQLGEEELTPIIKKIIEETGAASMKDMGKVMGAASKQLAGQADGKVISAVVKNMLS